MTEEKYGKVIVQTALKTILFVVGFVCLFLSYIFVLSPETLSSFYSNMKMGRAEIASYEQVYKKTQSNSDLYNLIQKCLEKENYQKSKTYIYELLEKESYDEFADKVNKLSLDNVEPKDAAHVVDLDTYLYTKLLECEYRLGNKTKAKKMALDDLNQTDNKYMFLFGVYYDEVLTDLSLTVAEAQRHLTDIFDTDGVKQKIDAKIEACDYTIETDTKLKAATLYTKMKIMNYKRNILRFKGEDVKVDTMTSEINSLNSIYEDLIA